jgi:membrane-associated protein
VSVDHLIASLGTLGLLGVIFVETGLFCFFFPGDSLLVAAGAFAAPGRHTPNIHLNLAVLLIGASAAAAVGAEVGYFVGRFAGVRLFNRPDSRLLKPAYVDRANWYFDRFGNVTVVLARFVPVVRTFANPVAGAGRMDAKVFTLFNVVSAIGWVSLVTLLGYFIGNSVKDSELIPAVIVVSLIPLGIEAIRVRRELRSQH